jgi:hypothetical protein
MAGCSAVAVGILQQSALPTQPNLIHSNGKKLFFFLSRKIYLTKRLTKIQYSRCIKICIFPFMVTVKVFEFPAGVLDAT